jgi:hypothetical protein
LILVENREIDIKLRLNFAKKVATLSLNIVIAEVEPAFLCNQIEL